MLPYLHVVIKAVSILYDFMLRHEMVALLNILIMTVNLTLVLVFKRLYRKQTEEKGLKTGFCSRRRKCRLIGYSFKQLAPRDISPRETQSHLVANATDGNKNESSRFTTANEFMETRIYSFPESSSSNNDETLNEITWGFDSSTSPRLNRTDGRDNPIQALMMDAIEGRSKKLKSQNQNKKNSSAASGKKKEKSPGKKRLMGKRRRRRENAINTDKAGGNEKATEVTKHKEMTNQKTASTKRRQFRKRQIVRAAESEDRACSGIMKGMISTAQINKEYPEKKYKEKSIKKSEQQALSCDSDIELRGAVCQRDHGLDLSNGTRSEASLVCKRDSWIWFSPDTRPSMENFASRQRKFQSQDPRVAKLAAEIRRQEHLNRDIEREAESLIESSSMSTGPHQLFPLLTTLYRNMPSSRLPFTHTKGGKRTRPSPYSRPNQMNNTLTLHHPFQPHVNRKSKDTQYLPNDKVTTAGERTTRSKLPQRLKGRGIHTHNSNSTSPKREKMRGSELNTKNTSPQKRKFTKYFRDDEGKTNDSVASSSLSKPSLSYRTTSIASSPPPPIEYYNSPDAEKIGLSKQNERYSPLYDNSTLMTSRSSGSTSKDKESNTAITSDIFTHITSIGTINIDGSKTDTLPEGSTSHQDIHPVKSKSPLLLVDSRLAIDSNRKTSLLSVSACDSESESAAREKSAKESIFKQNFISREVNSTVNRILFDAEQSSSSQSPSQFHTNMAKLKLATDKNMCGMQDIRPSVTRLPHKVTQEDRTVAVREKTPEVNDNDVCCQTSVSHQPIASPASDKTQKSRGENPTAKTKRINIYARDYYLGKRFTHKKEKNSCHETPSSRFKSEKSNFMSVKDQTEPVSKLQHLMTEPEIPNDVNESCDPTPTVTKSRLPRLKLIHFPSSDSVTKVLPPSNESQSLVFEPQASVSLETKGSPIAQSSFDRNVDTDKDSNNSPRRKHSTLTGSSSDFEKTLTYSDTYWATQATVRKCVSPGGGPIVISRSHQGLMFSKDVPCKSYRTSSNLPLEASRSVLNLQPKAPITQISSEPSVLTPIEPKPLSTTLGPDILRTSVESNILSTFLEPNILSAPLEPNILPAPLEPNILPSFREPNILPASSEPVIVLTSPKPISVFMPPRSSVVACTNLRPNLNVASKSTNNSSNNFPFRGDGNSLDTCKPSHPISSTQIYFVSQTQGCPLSIDRHENDQSDLGISNNAHIDVLDLPWKNMSTEGTNRKTRKFLLDEHQVDGTRKCCRRSTTRTVPLEKTTKRTINESKNDSKANGLELEVNRLKSTSVEVNSRWKTMGNPEELLPLASVESSTFVNPFTKPFQSAAGNWPKDFQATNNDSILASTLSLPPTSSDEEDEVDDEKDNQGGKVISEERNNPTEIKFVTGTEVTARHLEHILCMSSAVINHVTNHVSNPDSGYDESTSEKLTDHLNKSSMCHKYYQRQDISVLPKTDFSMGKHCFPEQTDALKNSYPNLSMFSYPKVSHSSEDMTCKGKMSNNWVSEHQFTPLATSFSYPPTPNVLSLSHLPKRDGDFIDTELQDNNHREFKNLDESYSTQCPDNTKNSGSCLPDDENQHKSDITSFSNKPTIQTNNGVATSAENVLACQNSSLLQNDQNDIRRLDTHCFKTQPLNIPRNPLENDTESSHSTFRRENSLMSSGSPGTLYSVDDVATADDLSFTFHTNSESSCLDIEDCILEISTKDSPVELEGHQMDSNFATPKTTPARMTITNQRLLDVSDSSSTVADMKFLASLESLQLSNSEMSQSSSFDVSSWSNPGPNENKVESPFISLANNPVSKDRHVSEGEQTKVEKPSKTNSKEEESFTEDKTKYTCITQVSKEDNFIDGIANKIMLPPTSSDDETDEENDHEEENRPLIKSREDKLAMEISKTRGCPSISRSDFKITNSRKRLLSESGMSSQTTPKSTSQIDPTQTRSTTYQARNRVIIPKRSVQFSDLLKRF